MSIKSERLRWSPKWCSKAVQKAVDKKAAPTIMFPALCSKRATSKCVLTFLPRVHVAEAQHATNTMFDDGSGEAFCWPAARLPWASDKACPLCDTFMALRAVFSQGSNSCIAQFMAVLLRTCTRPIQATSCVIGTYIFAGVRYLMDHHTYALSLHRLRS